MPMPVETSEDLMHELGRLIEEACERGETNRSLADKAGVQLDLISGLRNGTYGSVPSISRVESILRVLGFRLQIARNR